jgi:hypothetical protein
VRPGNISVDTTMPRRRVAGIVLGMTESGRRTLRVELEFVPDAEPIRGHARDADGIEYSFAGWLELVALLDQARLTRPGSPAARKGESR